MLKASSASIRGNWCRSKRSFPILNDDARQIGGVGRPSRRNLLQDLVQVRQDVPLARVHAPKLEYLAVPLLDANGLARGERLLGRPMAQLSATDGLGCHKCKHPALALVPWQGRGSGQWER